ncbi:hypothetical protein D3C80_1528010 [compost metagenome]
MVSVKDGLKIWLTKGLSSDGFSALPRITREALTLSKRLARSSKISAALCPAPMTATFNGPLRPARSCSMPPR